jgi:hypothetical protein
VDTLNVRPRIETPLEHHIETPVGTPGEGSTMSPIEAHRELELVGV